MQKAISPLDINLVRKVGYPPLCSEVLLIPLWRGVTRTPVGDLDPNPKNISYPKFSGRLVKGGGRPVYPGVTVADEVRDGA